MAPFHPRPSAASRLRTILTGVTLATLASLALAQGAYESPTTFKASEILPASLVQGPHYQVAEEVKTEGFLHDFVIRSDYGTFEAEGRSMLYVRLREVQALAALEDVSKTEVFLKAAGNSVLNVGRSFGQAVADPKATVKGIGGGLKRFAVNLGRKTKRAAGSAADAVKKDDDERKEGAKDEKSTGDKAAEAGAGVAKSVFGVNASARRWAQKLGVDPYSSNPVLRKALEDIGKIDAGGGIATKVVVPIPMVVGATATVGNLVWGKDPEELRKLNEQRAAEIGVSKEMAGPFFKNKAFSLTQDTRFIAALHAVRVKGAADYVDAARESETEREAEFFAESAEMLERFHAASAVAEILTDSKTMVAKAKDGRVVVLLPVDWVRWSEPYQKALLEIGERAKKEWGAKGLEMRLTGRMSDQARRESTALGWSVTEKVRGTIQPPETTAAGGGAREVVNQ